MIISMSNNPFEKIYVDALNKYESWTQTHSKPIELQRRLISATTKDGDVVLDPASGGYSVFEACKALGRDFIGGDIQYGE